MPQDVKQLDRGTAAGSESARSRGVTEWCHRLAEDARFQSGIIAIIVLNAVLMGLETSPRVITTYGALVAGAGVAVQAVFVVEWPSVSLPPGR